MSEKETLMDRVSQLQTQLMNQTRRLKEADAKISDAKIDAKISREAHLNESADPVSVQTRIVTNQTPTGNYPVSVHSSSVRPNANQDAEFHPKVNPLNQTLITNQSSCHHHSQRHHANTDANLSEANSFIPHSKIGSFPHQTSSIPHAHSCHSHLASSHQRPHHHDQDERRKDCYHDQDGRRKDCYHDQDGRRKDCYHDQDAKVSAIHKRCCNHHQRRRFHSLESFGRLKEASDAKNQNRDQSEGPIKHNHYCKHGKRLS